MRKLLPIVLLLLCVKAYSQVINFPDANLKNALLNYSPVIDTNNDGEIDQAEALVPTALSISNAGITDATGIEFFTSLIDLRLFGNNLTSIDISSNTVLRIFQINSNPITTLDVSNNSALEQLFFADSANLSSITLPTSTTNLAVIAGRNNTSLTSIDVSPYPNLIILRLNGASLTSLDVSSNPALQILQCTNNNLTALNVSSNSNLTELSCQDNSITSLDLSSNTSLNNLLCGNNSLFSLNVKNGNNANLNMDTVGNSNLVCIQVDDAVAAATHPNFSKDAFTNYSDTNPCSPFINFLDANLKAAIIAAGVDLNNDGEIQFNEALIPTNLILTNLNISDATGIEFFTSLTILRIDNNNIPAIDISGMTSLIELSISNNSLTSINTTSNTALANLDVGGNNFTVIDVSNNADLNQFFCDSNSLTGLDVSNNIQLSSLDCSGNNLTALDTSSNINLEFLVCFNNDLTNLAISSSNTTLEKLLCHDNNLTTLNVSGNTTLEELNCSNNNISILDLTNNSNLDIVECQNNTIGALDLSNCPSLFSLDCSTNNLTQLDIKNGNNTNLFLDARTNPNLSCINVDDAVAATANTNFNKDATASYSLACGPTVSILNAPTTVNNLTPFNVTFLFDRDVTSFDINDIVLTNATASNFSAASGPNEYTALITPTSLCNIDITINVPANAATDANSPNLPNSAASQVTVTTTDGIDPVALTKNIALPLDAFAQASITASDIDDGSTDNCGIASMSVNISNFDCSTTGDNTVILSVTDNDGNISAGTAIVTVTETISPVASANDITVQLDASGQVMVSTLDVDNGSSDNCAITGASLSKSTFTCADLGVNEVVFTVSDASGNTDTATIAVTVEDVIAPTAIAQNITVQLDANGQATITGSDINNGSTDNCTVNLAVAPNNFTCSDIGQNVVVLTVIDGSGNSDTANATVTVEDTFAPNVITQNVTIALDANEQVSIQVSDIDDGSTDNCGISTTILDKTDFICSDLGANTVTLTVTDSNGNSQTGTATVTVEDTTAPTVATQDITVQLDTDGQATISAQDIDNSSSDSCSGIDSMSLDITSFNCPNLGNVTVTLTVTDNSGNSATETATVTIESIDENNNNISDNCESLEVIVPGGFSPNGDSIKDTWIIENIEDFPNNNVQVFNRWGELVFEANNYQNNWNGVSNKVGNGNKKLPVGAYLYIINLNEAEFIPKKGWIYINY